MSIFAYLIMKKRTRTDTLIKVKKKYPYYVVKRGRGSVFIDFAVF